MRTYPLPKREIDIGLRLRIWRESVVRYTRTKFAKSLGVSTERIAHIEAGRSPLRYEMAAKITSTYAINPIWLATGETQNNSPLTLPSYEAIEVSPQELFSKVFDEKLQDWSKSILERARNSGFQIHFDPNPNGRRMAKEWLTGKLDDLVEGVPFERLSSFVNEVLSFAQQLNESYPNRKPSIVLTQMSNVIDISALEAEEKRLEELRKGKAS